MVFPFTNPLTSPNPPAPLPPTRSANAMFCTTLGQEVGRKRRKKRDKGKRKSSGLSITLDYDRRMVSNDITK